MPKIGYFTIYSTLNSDILMEIEPETLRKKRCLVVNNHNFRGVRIGPKMLISVTIYSDQSADHYYVTSRED